MQSPGRKGTSSGIVIGDVVERKTNIKPSTSRGLSLIVQLTSTSYSNVPGCWNSTDSKSNNSPGSHRVQKNGNALGTKKKHTLLFHVYQHVLRGCELHESVKLLKDWTNPHKKLANPENKKRNKKHCVFFEHVCFSIR